MKCIQTYKDEFHCQSFPTDDEYHILFRCAMLISQLTSNCKNKLNHKTQAHK